VDKCNFYRNINNMTLEERIIEELKTSPPIKAEPLSKVLNVDIDMLHRELRRLTLNSTLTRTGNGFYMMKNPAFEPDCKPIDYKTRSTAAAKHHPSVYHCHRGVGETRELIADLMEKNPGISTRMIAGQLQLSKGTVNYHRSRIEAAKIIQAQDEKKLKSQQEKEVTPFEKSLMLQQAREFVDKSNRPMITVPELQDSEGILEMAETLAAIQGPMGEGIQKWLAWTNDVLKAVQEAANE